MRWIRLFLFFFTSIGMVSVACADAALLKQKSAEAFIETMVRQHHFKRQAVVLALKEARFQPQII